MLDRLFNPNPTIHKWDRFWVGFLPALFAPLLVIVVFHWGFYNNISFSAYLEMVKKPSVLSPILSLGVVLNLFIFFPLMWRDYFNAARGAIGATILYIIPIVVTKFFM